MPSPGPKKYGKTKLNHRRKWTNQGFTWRRKHYKSAVIGVAEGDSWFDYSPAWFEVPTKGDLLAHLMQSNDKKRYNIYRVSKGGDTLDNMAYGTDYKESDWTPKPASLAKTLQALQDHDAKFFLFSAGGNDVAGPELESLLNHRNSTLPALRPEAVDELFKSTIPKAFEHVIQAVRGVRPGIPIFLHGYGHTEPTGKGVINFPGGWRIVGPWLRPALTKKRWLQEPKQKQIIRKLINRLNDCLIGVAAAHSNVHFIDLRTKLQQSDWINELHLNQTGWKKAALEFDKKMAPVLGL